MTSAVADLVGRVLVQRYRLLAPIGVGASGRVYMADDVRLRRQVAVKVLQPGLGDDAGFIRRFRAEAQLAASLHHPNVMAVYDWGQDEGLAFMVVELLRGGSLRALLDHGSRLSPAQGARVGRPVAEALQYAHERGLVHRDIKPANLLFDEHGTARVADFGLARALAEASWTEPVGALVGTARYAAPEQGGTAPLDGRADLYSLAVVLVEACTGEVPVVADSPIGTLAARTVRGITAPPELGALGAVIERAGRPDRTDRYPDAGTMVAALGDVARRLPPPEPLTLPGLGDAAPDVDPTRVGRVGDPAATLAGDATAAEDDDALPMAIPIARRRRSAVPIVVGVAIAIAVIAAAVLLFGGGAGAGTTAVPALVGHGQKDAATLATNAGVLMKVTGSRQSDDPAGVVLSQSPGPGDFVSKGGAVDVTVSRGPPPIAVPAVAQRSLSDAQAILGQAGFVVSLDHRYDENIPKGTVISTDPTGGAKAPPESTIKLVVSDGPAPVTIPDVSGQSSYTAAAQVLSGKRLSPTAQPAYSDTVPPGGIVGTSPPAGTSVPRDSQVTVLVSLGPQPVTIPNLVGQPVETASEALSALGLVPNVDNFGPGKPVKAISPAPGTTVKKGTTVTLIL